MPHYSQGGPHIRIPEELVDHITAKAIPTQVSQSLGGYRGAAVAFKALQVILINCCDWESLSRLTCLIYRKSNFRIL